MAFQIIDDMLDLAADEKVLGKPTGNDLRQGNLSLAVLWVLRSQGKEAAALALHIKALQQGDEAALPPTLALVRQSGGLGFAADCAVRFLTKCEQEQRLWSSTAKRTRQTLNQVLQEFKEQAQNLADKF